MRSLFRFALAATALSVAFTAAAHAAPVTYSGSATLSDTSGLFNNNVSFSGGTTFSFTNPPTSSETVQMTITGTEAFNSCSNCSDTLSVDVVFNSPNYNGSNDITGDGTVNGHLNADGSITWTSGENQLVTFNDGTSVSIDLANIAAGGFTYDGTNPITGIATYSANDALTITVDTPAAATPEPSSLILLGTGLLGSVGIMRRRFSL